jgi:hypothetical protein
MTAAAAATDEDREERLKFFAVLAETVKKFTHNNNIQTGTKIKTTVN